MKFGLSVYQTAARYGLLEDTEKPITVGSFIQSIDSIKELGFSHYEILTDPLMKALKVDERRLLFEKLAEYNEKNNMSMSVHMPFWWIDISVPDQAIREASVNQLITLIKETEIMNPTHYVIHALQRVTIGQIKRTKLSYAVKNELMEDYYNTVRDSIRLISSSIDDSKKIAIENLQQESDYSKLWSLAEEFNLSINYDYGHQFLAEQNVFKGFDSMWPRIASIHAHNIIIEKTGHGEECVLKDHYALSTGIIDTSCILEYLKDKDYQGLYVVEVMRKEDAVESARFLKKHGLL